MVNLPTVQDRVVTSQAPQSSVTRSDIQQNANMMAGAIDKTADALMDVSVEAAKTQAADDLINQKVTRNADGSVSVANPANSLLFGRAGDVYNNAVKVGTLAQHANDLSQQFAEMHTKFPTDPAGFKAAAEAYLNARKGQVTGQVGELVQRQGAQLLTQHLNAIANTAAKADLARSSSSIEALQTSARDDVQAMMRGGASLQDPSVIAKFQQWDSAAQQRLANPLFGYSKEQYELDRQHFEGEAIGGGFLHDVKKTYDAQGEGGGYAGAMAKAQTILTDPRIAMGMAQREQFYHRSVSDIRANEALRHQSVADARAAFTELLTVSATGGRVDSNQIEQNAAAFRAAGDPAGAARVYAAFARKPLNDDFGKQPLPQQAAQLNGLRGANAAATAQSFFVSRGYTSAQAAGIVGNLVHESGMDASASGDNGTSGGLAQFHNERLTALRTFAAGRGKPATDFQTQLEFIDHELNTTEASTLAKLKAAKTPEDAAAAFINYERPKGWTPENPAGGLGYASRIALARKVFAGAPGDVSLGPAGSAWLIQNRARTVASAAETQWQTVMKDYADAGILPSKQRVSDIVNAAHAANDPNLLEQIAHDAERMDVAQTAARLPLSQQQDQINRLLAAGHNGALNPGAAASLKDLQRRYTAVKDGLNTDPISTTLSNFGDKFQSPGPLDMSSDDAFVNGLQARARIAQFAARNWQTPPLSALDTADVKQVQAALASPDPAVKVRIFRAISTLPEDIRGTTMAKLGDTGPVAATEVFAGSLLSQAPDVAGSILTGLNAQNTDTRFVPSKGANADAFRTAKETTLPIAAFNLSARSNPSGSYAVMQMAIDARYAALSAQAGDTSGSVNRSRLKQATDDVTGGILYHNSAPVIAPARGMSQRQFDGIMAGITDADVAGMTTGKGTPITADYLRNSAKLHALYSGRYLVQVNGDDSKPLYAKGSDGKPFVLDLRNRQAAPITLDSAHIADNLALAP